MKTRRENELIRRSYSRSVLCRTNCYVGMFTDFCPSHFLTCLYIFFHLDLQSFKDAVKNKFIMTKRLYKSSKEVIRSKGKVTWKA
uniref:Uncharacterized protein n=1 Tax=Onchocerca volvulus TaxID=6282 RepID=A0A8R1TWY6_ONCVO